MSHNYQYETLEFLKLCLKKEFIVNDEKAFSWLRILRRYFKYPDRRIYLYLRIACFLYLNGHIKFANFLRIKMKKNYGCEIALGAKIGPGIKIEHSVGLVIAHEVIVGNNLNIRQNTTIGVKSSLQEKPIVIGNDVSIGANSCIIGDGLNIGNNVLIGAMSFINKDIPDNCIVKTPKNNNIIQLSTLRNSF